MIQQDKRKKQKKHSRQETGPQVEETGGKKGPTSDTIGDPTADLSEKEIEGKRLYKAIQYVYREHISVSLMMAHSM